MARILVTGAAGFAGAHLLPALARLPGAEISAPGFDVTDADATRQAVAAERPDACIHLAAVAGIPAAQAGPDAAWRVNLHGTLNLARALVAETPWCTLLFVSTADAYGSSFQRGAPVDEDAKLAPMNTYGATKAAADLALGAMVGDGLKVIRVRPFNHTGRGQSPAFVVAAFARQVARIAAGLQPPVIRVGALDPWRDFLDVRDVCAAYIACITTELPSGTVLNLASGVPRRIGDVLAELIDIAGIAAEIEVDGGRLRRSEIPTATGDASRAAQLLGWTPQIAWRQTLTDVLDDWRGRVSTEA